VLRRGSETIIFGYESGSYLAGHYGSGSGSYLVGHVNKKIHFCHIIELLISKWCLHHCIFIPRGLIFNDNFGLAPDPTCQVISDPDPSCQAIADPDPNRQRSDPADLDPDHQY